MKAVWFGRYFTIFPASYSVNHTDPHESTLIFLGLLRAIGTSKLSHSPDLGSNRAIFLASDIVNQMNPLESAVMPHGLLPSSTGYSVNVPSVELSLPILSVANSVNQT